MRRREDVIWVAACVTALAVVAAFWLPGAAVLGVLGLRGVSAVAWAPLVTLGLVGVATIALAAVGIPWGVPAALAVAGLATAIAGVLRRARGPMRALPSAHRWTPAAVVAGVAAQVVPVAVGMGRPDRLVDAFDAVGHFNGIAYVRETGLGSSFTITGVHSGVQTGGFDGAAWPAVTALVPPWPDPVVVFTVATYLPTAIAWTTGAVVLTRAVLPGRPRAAAWAALASGAGIALPHVLAQQQAGLIPNAVAAALLPAFVALVLEADRAWNARWAALVAVAGLGLGLTHPNVAILAGVALAPCLLVRHRRALRRLAATPRGRIVMWAVAAATVLAAVRVLTDLRMRGVMAYHGDAAFPWQDTLVDVLTGQMGITTGGGGVFVVVAAAVGAWILRRHERARVLLAGSGAVLALFVLARSDLPVLGDLDGPWFHETKRIAPGVLALLVPFAAVALDAGGAWLVASGRLRTTLRPRAAATLLAGLLVAVGTALGAVATARDASLAYRHPPGWTTFATDDELAMMRRLADELDPDAAVLGSPHSGAAHLYGLIGQRVTLRTTATPLSPELLYVARHLDELGDDDLLCQVLEAQEIRYLYVDPVLFRQERSDLGHVVDPRTTDLRLVDRGGTAAVYEITTCG